MKFSTRTTYGLRAMICLAKNYGKESLALSAIAKEENLSLGYLERIFSKLKKGKLVKAEKGASGGYALIKDPKDIAVYDIIKILEGSMSPFHCLDESGKIFCSQKCQCGANAVLLKVQKAVNDVLRGIKLSEL